MVSKMFDAHATRGDILAAISRMEDGKGTLAGFEDWWLAFPNKTGKGAARTAYQRATLKTTPQVLLDALMLYASKRDDRPWCNPATWLNQERWCDEAAAPVLRNDSLGATFLTAAIAAKEKEDGTLETVDLFGGDVRRISGR
jgi:hypothetical protein